MSIEDGTTTHTGLVIVIISIGIEDHYLQSILEAGTGQFQEIMSITDRHITQGIMFIIDHTAQDQAIGQLKHLSTDSIHLI